MAEINAFDPPEPGANWSANDPAGPAAPRRPRRASDPKNLDRFPSEENYNPFDPAMNVQHPVAALTPGAPKGEFGPLGPEARIKQGWQDVYPGVEDRRAQGAPLWEAGRLFDPHPLEQYLGDPRMEGARYWPQDNPLGPARVTSSDFARALMTPGQLELAHREDLHRIAQRIIKANEVDRTK